MLRKKNIVLNGKKADGAVRVREGDVVTLYLAEDTIRKFRTAEADAARKLEAYRQAYATVRGNVFEGYAEDNVSFAGDAEEEDAARTPVVVYEDDAILLLCKPQGILSQKDSGATPSINEWAVGYMLETGSIREEALTAYTPSVANRLDRNTSGLMVVTKTRAAARAFSELQREKRLEKTYHAVVIGKTKTEDAVFETVEQDNAFNRMRIMKEGQKTNHTASLRYRTLAYSKEPDLSLLSIALSDGKKHQIRAQLANIGHPVLLDEKYGNKAYNRLFLKGLSSGAQTKEPPVFKTALQKEFRNGMQILHSFSLTFPAGLTKEHPLTVVSGKTFVAPLPFAFERLMLSFYQNRNVVYILQCADDSLYCGWTNDIAGRLQAHNAGKGAKYTRGRGPVHPVYLRAFDTKEEAMKEEARVKLLSRAEKLALIR